MRKLILGIVSACLALPSFADEGMWLLPLLKQQKYTEMRQMGLQMEADDIYNPAGVSLKDAVVRFGGGCTGEVVSADGLVLTNHHCGYGYIQRHSSVEHDYLTDGFWAMSREEELPNPGLTVTFIEKIEDVTDYVMKALEKEKDQTLFTSSSYLNKLAVKRAGGERELKKHPGMAVEIKAFYDGNKYYMFTKKIYSDIRLVGAPPSSIGKFGADTDNWMWPRHTGDFSIFRIYADKNGEPAPYSKDNVPLRPKRWLKVSTDGVKADDYAMIIGFPGRTNKYYTSWEVAERRDIENTVRIHVRELRQEAMLEEMLKDDKVRIQYASKYAGSTNSYKSSIGSNWAINKRNFEQVKREEQEKLLAWAKLKGDPAYAEALAQLERIVKEREAFRFRSMMLSEALERSIEFSSVPTDTEALIKALNDKDEKKTAELMAELEKGYLRFANKDYAPAVDKKISKIILKDYLAQVKTGNRPAYLEVIGKDFGGDVNRFVDHLFEASIFGSNENFNQFKANPTADRLANDPMILFAQSVKAEKKALNESLSSFNNAYNQARRVYMRGVLEMNGELNLSPDANSTMRITYGQVKGYSPRDCDFYGHQTTLDGVMEKEDPDNWEFVVPERLKALYEAKDFGRYALPDGRMPVAFCATTHTTGGNSGSPVMNAKGELIGINFDRNWEGVGGDIEYLPDYQRSIIVDIRYVLFVIDKYAGATSIVNELLGE